MNIQWGVVRSAFLAAPPLPSRRRCDGRDTSRDINFGSPRAVLFRFPRSARPFCSTIHGRDTCGRSAAADANTICSVRHALSYATYHDAW